MPSEKRKVFTLLVELRCNSYCVFCGQREVDEALVRTRRRLGLSVPKTSFGDRRGRFTLESAVEVLRRAREDGFTELSLQGGEPTIWPDLPELVRRAHGLSFDFVGMVTNGRRLKDRAYTRELIEAGLDGITASLLGADAETHDGISVAPGSFDALLEGLGHASDIAKEQTRPIKINASLITSDKTVDRMDEQVRLLAERNVAAASVHLVRFTGLASDPAVRAAMAFDLRRLAPALAKAMAEGKKLGMRVHATDVPPCVHPSLSADELALLARRVSVEAHHYEAAAYAYEANEGEKREAPEVCTGCLLFRACPRAPEEYLPPDPRDVLVPITPSSVRERIDEALAAVSPARPGAAGSIAELERTVDLLEEIAGLPGALSDTRSCLHEARRDMLLAALAQKNLTATLDVFCAEVGLEPSRRWGIADLIWDDLALSLSRLAARTRASTHLPANASFTLRLGGRFDAAIVGSRDSAGDIVVNSVTPLVHEVKSRVDHALRALHLLVFCAALRNVSRIRLTAMALEIDRGDGFAPAFVLARKDAIVLIENG